VFHKPGAATRLRCGFCCFLYLLAKEAAPAIVLTKGEGRRWFARHNQFIAALFVLLLLLGVGFFDFKPAAHRGAVSSIEIQSRHRHARARAESFSMARSTLQRAVGTVDSFTDAKAPLQPIFRGRPRSGVSFALSEESAQASQHNET
jgi:hypothetical protein